MPLGIGGPGRREDLRRFWVAIAAGRSSEEAAVGARVSPAVGVRWFRRAGGMPDPIADRLPSRFELMGPILRIAADADQINHLTAKLRRISRTCLGHSMNLL